MSVVSHTTILLSLPLLQNADSFSVTDFTTPSVYLTIHFTNCPVFLFTVVSHTASLFPKSPQLNSYGLLGAGPLRLSVRHQSQGRMGSTSVTLRNASSEKKLISSAGSQPRGVLCGDWSQWEALLGGGYKSSLNPMTQQSWVRVRWHFAAI